MAVLHRVDNQITDSNFLLASMGDEAANAFVNLSAMAQKMAQKMLVTDHQVNANEIPAILDHLKAYPEVN